MICIYIAISAFDAALKQMDGIAEDDAAREAVAFFIIERMLRGERDPIRLRDGALARARPASEG
jgi:hypothetical protein